MTTTNRLALPGAIQNVVFLLRSSRLFDLCGRQFNRNLPVAQEFEQNTHARIARNAGVKNGLLPGKRIILDNDLFALVQAIQLLAARLVDLIQPAADGGDQGLKN